MRAELQYINPLLIIWSLLLMFSCSVVIYFWQNLAHQTRSASVSVATGNSAIEPSSKSQYRPRAKVATQSALRPKNPSSVIPKGSSVGNSYAAGNCTWYAKYRRPDLPNNLGNAYSWVSRARAQGRATGSIPRVGAIGQRGNHVVYVEQVNPNNTVSISEMNFTGYGKISHRTLPANSFTYIY